MLHHSSWRCVLTLGALGLGLMAHALQGAEIKATAVEITQPRPPQIDHFEGRVVRRASGEYSVTNGFYCFQFPAAQAAALAPYVGRYVDVEYRMVQSELHFYHQAFDRILSVTPIEETPEALPIAVTITPVKPVFTSAEPIVARVVLENRTQEVLSLALTASHAMLSRDYEKVFWLEPDNHSYPEKSYRFEGRPNLGKLAPGERLVFTIESRRMAEPGRYDLNYVVCQGVRMRDCFSAFVPVDVVAAAGAGRVAVLKSWLKKAALEQRIEIANELVKLGDPTVAAEFLEQVKSGIYRANGFFYRSAYEFAIRHCAEPGERVVMTEIKWAKFQERAADFMPFLFKSKNRVPLFADLIACRAAMEYNLQDWVEHPRICDIAADLLMSQASPEMEFPRLGSEAERDAAVARVQRALQETPQMFSGLKNKLP